MKYKITLNLTIDQIHNLIEHCTSEEDYWYRYVWELNEKWKETKNELINQLIIIGKINNNK